MIQVPILSLSQRASQNRGRQFQETTEEAMNISISSLPYNPLAQWYGQVKTVSLYDWVKRFMDILISSIVLVLFSPLWLLFGLIIKVTSRGPVLFRNVVIGQHGKPFIYYKFRTMVHNGSDAEHRKFVERFVKQGEPYEGEAHSKATATGEAEANASKATAASRNKTKVYKLINDPRVTPFGRFLRKSSLDEIPQMINVLRGEMSLVGPRPPVQYEYELYGDWEKQRLAVKPGITGLYQVTARSQVPFQEMVRIDLDYIQRRSLCLDLWIILKTLVVIARGEGAG